MNLSRLRWPLCVTALCLCTSLPAAAQEPHELPLEEEADEGFTDPFAPQPSPAPPFRIAPGEEVPYTPRRRVQSPAPYSTPRPLYEDAPSEDDSDSCSSSSYPRGGMGWAPSVGAAILLKFVDEIPGRDEQTDYSFPLWLGATLYPSLGTISPFANLHLGFDFTVGDVRTTLEYLPTARFGVAMLDGSPQNFESQLLPLFMGYAILGARYAPGSASERLRVGIGLSSPALVPASLYMCANGLPIPNIIEYVVELDLVTQRPQHTLMFGIGL